VDTFRFAPTRYSKETLENIHRRFVGMGLLVYFAAQGRREHARKELRICFGSVEKIFGPRQIVFRGPYNWAVLFIHSFICQVENWFYRVIFHKLLAFPPWNSSESRGSAGRPMTFGRLDAT
jgi:hypothetical protein